jgi:hypothetical protein
MKVLIAVFMGLACGFAIQKIIGLDNMLEMVFYSIIFGTTIIRFFEGNIIYYGKEHVENGTVITQNIKSKIDIYSTLLQFIIFCAIGHLIGSLELFVYAFIFLNFIDFVWHGFAYLNSSDKSAETTKTSLFWSLSNLVFGILLICLYVLHQTAIIHGSISFLSVFAFISIIATCLDYCVNKDFYFSDDAKKIFENY